MASPRRESYDEMLKTAVGDFTAQHKVSLSVVGAAVLAAFIHGGSLGFSWVPSLMLALLYSPVAYGLRRGVAGWWWRRQHARKLARAALPLPGRKTLRAAAKLERAHKATAKRQWSLYCAANKITGFSGTTPALRKLDGTIEGDLTALISPGPLGVKGGVSKVREHRIAIAETIGCKHLVVRETGVGHAVLTFLWTDKFERNLPIQELPVAPKGRIAYGIHRDGSVASLDPNKSTLVAGVQGSGKSSMVWTILSHWLRVGEWVDLYVIDPKGGQEWGWLLRMATIAGCRVKVKGFATDEADAIEMLNEALDRVKARQLENGVVDLDDWSKDPVRQVVPTETEPRIVILADELLHLRKALKDTAAVPSPFGQFISIGRSAAASVIAVSQDATKETVGMVRDLFGQRVALRTSSPAMTNMVLADGAEARGATCSRIPESTPGIGFAYDADAGVEVEVRIAHVADSDIKNDIQYGRPPAGMTDGTIQVEQPYFNYRFYTSDRQPLRTGITNDFGRRYKEYRASYEKERVAIEAGYLDPAKALHQWFPFHDPQRTIVTEADNKTAAKRIESGFIATGVWRGNHQENMNSPLRNVPPPQEKPHHWWTRTPKPDPQMVVNPSPTAPPVEVVEPEVVEPEPEFIVPEPEPEPAVVVQRDPAPVVVKQFRRRPGNNFRPVNAPPRKKVPARTAPDHLPWLN